MFNENDKVITSKGRFGKIIYSNEFKSIVQIGSKNIEILNTELILASKSIALQVEYSMGFEHCRDIIHINSNISLFDYSNPMKNDVYEECKLKIIKKIGNQSQFTINKIILA